MDESNIQCSIFKNIEAYHHDVNIKKVVFTNGCFDIIHQGHLHNLISAKGLGDILILGLNSDASVKKLKGSERPINTWMVRAKTLAALGCIDIIIGFEEDTPMQLIKTIKPNIICKGGDYTMDRMIGRDFVQSYGGEVIILPYIKGFSTTEEIKKRYL